MFSAAYSSLLVCITLHCFPHYTFIHSRTKPLSIQAHVTCSIDHTVLGWAFGADQRRAPWQQTAIAPFDGKARGALVWSTTLPFPGSIQTLQAFFSSHLFPFLLAVPSISCRLLRPHMLSFPWRFVFSHCFVLLCLPSHGLSLFSSFLAVSTKLHSYVHLWGLYPLVFLFRAVLFTRSFCGSCGSHHWAASPKQIYKSI